VKAELPIRKEARPVRLFSALLVGSILAAAQHAAAAISIFVSTPANLLIPDDSAPDAIHLNNFGAMIPGEARTHAFRVHNLSDTTTAAISYVLDTGGGVFVLAATTGFDVAPSGFQVFLITFTAPDTLLHTGKLTISQGGGSFVVNLSGRGLPLISPDLSLQQLKPAKVKLNKKTGLLDVRIKLQLTNHGQNDSTVPAVTFTASQTPFFSTPIVPLGTVTAKGILPFTPEGGKARSKKLNVKMTGLPNSPLFFFFHASSQGENELEIDEDDNALLVPVPLLPL
jgi:hypothetical protein